MSNLFEQYCQRRQLAEVIVEEQFPIEDFALLVSTDIDAAEEFVEGVGDWLHAAWSGAKNAAVPGALGGAGLGLFGGPKMALALGLGGGMMGGLGGAAKGLWDKWRGNVIPGHDDPATLEKGKEKKLAAARKQIAALQAQGKDDPRVAELLGKLGGAAA
jgi:hypothetical protein